MKLNMALAGMLTTTSLAGLLLMAPTALADCENYGSMVNIGSNYECYHEEYYCDGDAGAGSGTLAGGGAGPGGDSEVGAESSAQAGTECNQGTGYNQMAQDEAHATVQALNLAGSDEDAEAETQSAEPESAESGEPADDDTDG